MSAGDPAKWILLFDWDGTLIHSLDIKIHHAGLLFAEVFGLTYQDVTASYRRHSGIPRRDLFNTITRENGIPAPDEARYRELSRRFSALNLAKLTEPKTEGLVPAETRPALERLRALGHILYVSSASTPDELQTIARALGLASFFEEILGSDGNFEKGSQHVAYVMEQQKAPHSRIVMIGDEPRDVQLGREAGVRVIAKTGTFPAEKLEESGPDQIIASLAELPALLDRAW